MIFFFLQSKMTFSPENYTEFNEKLLSISKIADDLYYVKKYKIFYDAKELRITTPPSELNIFTDRYNQKQVRINNNDILFNKFIRKLECAINQICRTRFNKDIKLIHKNDIYAHILSEPINEKTQFKKLEITIPSINISKQGNLSCKVFTKI